MALSKQHYAIALSKLGAKVYFVNPPKLEYTIKNSITRVINEDNIFIINYNVFFPKKLKYRFFKLFSSINRLILTNVLKHNKLFISILWNFDNGLFFNKLPINKVKYKIFHPVDQLRIPIESRKYDIIFSLSHEILKSITNSNKHFINHGVSDDFVKYAEKQMELINKNNNVINKSKKITCAYIGNLLADAIDRKNFIKIIKQNTKINFLLIGVFSAKKSNLHNDENISSEASCFIDQLKSFNNVELLGPKSHSQIIEFFEIIDLFFMCYEKSNFYKCDNSHKVLEYLSSGKPVVSSYLSVYEKLDLIKMVQIGENCKLSELIQEELRFKNAIEKEEKVKRLNYVMSNSYSNQIELIQTILTTQNI